MSRPTRPARPDIRHPLLAGLAALALAGCSGPSVTTGPAANPSAARGLLVAAAAEGAPVPLAIDRAPPDFVGGPAEIAGTANRAVAWLGARFEPVGLGVTDPTRRRLVFRFEDVPASPAEMCAAAPPEGKPGPPPLRLYAVFCDGPRPVADALGTASGTTPDDTRALVTSVTNRLFPGDGGGYSSFPGVSLGVGVGSGGGWGLGGGLHF
jgi:hypothetical protein